MYFAYTFVIFRLQLPPAVKQMSMTKVSKRKRYWSNKQYLLVFFLITIVITVASSVLGWKMALKKGKM